MNSKPNIIILGPQGSGKTTQAKLLAEKFRYNLICTGKIIRKLIKDKGNLGSLLNKYYSTGKLVPTEILIKKIWLPHFRKLIYHQGFIFEGTPRSISQAKAIENFLKKEKIARPWLIYLSIKKSTILKRIELRKTCSKCGTNFKPDDKGYKFNKCTVCEGKLDVRQDDKNKSALYRRIKIFYHNTKPVIDYYNQVNRLIKINGEQTIPRVHKSILKAIKQIQQ